MAFDQARKAVTRTRSKWCICSTLWCALTSLAFASVPIFIGRVLIDLLLSTPLQQGSVFMPMNGTDSVLPSGIWRHVIGAINRTGVCDLTIESAWIANVTYDVVSGACSDYANTSTTSGRWFDLVYTASWGGYTILAYLISNCFIKPYKEKLERFSRMAQQSRVSPIAVGDFKQVFKKLKFEMQPLNHERDGEEGEEDHLD